MSLSVLLPLAIFFALGVPIVVLLWRVLIVGGELRRDAQHGRAAVDLARRVDISLGELSEIVDDLRRRKSGPDASAASLKASAEALRRYADEAAAVDGHLPQTGGKGLRAEIERAQRAVDLIEHGRQLMLDATVEHIDEGETSVKRGYLNLLHAREAIRSVGEGIATTVPARPAARGRVKDRIR
ncbi:MAG: hypothetical protein ACHQ01_00825 [Candidatus Limnocylindrales bacterium]